MVGFWSLSSDNFVWGLGSRLYKYVSKWLPCIFLILSFSLHVKWFCIQHWWWTSYRPLLLLYSVHLPRLWLRQPHKIPASSLSLTAGAPPNTKTLKWLLSCNIKPSWKFSKSWIDWFWNSDSQRNCGMQNSLQWLQIKKALSFCSSKLMSSTVEESCPLSLLLSFCKVLSQRTGVLKLKLKF